MSLKFAIGERRLRESTANHQTKDQITGSDRARVLFSSAFRRMQRKAQVFPLDLNASVRTRLVHSLEVGHIGRYIAETICGEVSDSRLEELEKHSSAFANIVETACFLHDIGNPPFGHLGELAIQEWFTKNFGKASPYDRSREIGDFAKFDGNCQGFRIVTKLQGEPGQKGLNLTLTQLASMIKYPNIVTRGATTETSGKFSIFDSEKQEFHKLWEEFELEKGQRHPFSYIMEAADDIAYCLSDIEDAIEKGILRASDLENLKQAILENGFNDKDRIVNDWQIEENNVTWSLIRFRTKLINLLTHRAAKVWLDDLDSIEAGERRELFDKESSEGRLLSAIKAFARTHVFAAEEAINPELSGYRAIHTLLDAFLPMLLMDRDKAKKLLSNPSSGKNTLEKRLALKLPAKYRRTYEIEAEERAPEDEWQLRAHLICDYICGMTDIYALQTCHTFAAIDP